MRQEQRLVSIYKRWASEPANQIFKGMCAHEAQALVLDHIKKNIKNPSNSIVVRRQFIRRMSQNQWLRRFIAAWEYFEGEKT